MKFSTKIRYGLRVMYELAKSYEGERAIFQKDISDAQKLPNKYLDHIVDNLKNAGLISNVRGKRSGYKLTRKPSEISMLDIHNAFAEGLYVIDCLSPHISCDAYNECPTVDFWEGVNSCITGYFNNTTLQDLLDNKVKKCKNQE